MIFNHRWHPRELTEQKLWKNCNIACMHQNTTKTEELYDKRVSSWVPILLDSQKTNYLCCYMREASR